MQNKKTDNHDLKLLAKSCKQITREGLCMGTGYLLCQLDKIRIILEERTPDEKTAPTR